jgi:hypothetical protein
MGATHRIGEGANGREPFMIFMKLHVTASRIFSNLGR